MKEIWKDIPDYEGLYQASNLGRIKSLIPWAGTQSRILKPANCDKYGHLGVALTLNKKHKTFPVHQLVLNTFVGKCPRGMECRHLDGNRINNKLKNLKWGTHSENMKDRIEHGTYQYGPDNPNVKLNIKQVNIIKYLIKTRILAQREIAEIFNIHQTTVHYIKKGKLWQTISRA